MAKRRDDPFATSDGPKMRSGRAPLSRFKPYPNNPRTHPPGELALLAKILGTRGFDQPIVVDDAWVILKGHGRLDAATMAGLADAPYVQRLGLSETEKAALRIEDNAVPLLAGWSAELLKAEITTLKLAGYDLPLLGFPEVQLRGFGIAMGTEGEVDPEETPPLPVNPVTRPGDLWICGDHRLLCGDATSESDVAACLAGARPHLMVTDAPYGVDYDPDWRNRADRANGKPYGASAIGLVQNDTTVDWRAAWALFPGATAASRLPWRSPALRLSAK